MMRGLAGVGWVGTVAELLRVTTVAAVAAELDGTAGTPTVRHSMMTSRPSVSI